MTSPRTVDAVLLDFLTDTIDGPATLTGPALDVLAANPLASALYGGFAAFDNLARMVFLDPAAQTFYADWDNAARGVVSNLRAGSAPFPDDPHVTAIVGELTVRSPAFGAFWARREVRPRTNEHKHLHHHQVGELDLRYQAFNVADAPGQQIFVYTAAPGKPQRRRATPAPPFHSRAPPHPDSISADPDTTDAGQTSATVPRPIRFAVEGELT